MPCDSIGWFTAPSKYRFIHQNPQAIKSGKWCDQNQCSSQVSAGPRHFGIRTRSQGRVHLCFFAGKVLLPEVQPRVVTNCTIAQYLSNLKKQNTFKHNLSLIQYIHIIYIYIMIIESYMICMNVRTYYVYVIIYICYMYMNMDTHAQTRLYTMCT